MVVDNDSPATPNSTMTDEVLTESEHDHEEAEELEVEEIYDAGVAQMQELVKQLEDYAPTVPDALTASFLNSAGLADVDPCIVRVISVTAQKFISDIANDALQHCKTRTTNTQHSSNHGSNKDKKNIKDRKYTLAMEDLAPALADHGITMRKPQYFV